MHFYPHTSHTLESVEACMVEGGMEGLLELLEFEFTKFAVAGIWKTDPVGLYVNMLPAYPADEGKLEKPAACELST